MVQKIIQALVDSFIHGALGDRKYYSISRDRLLGEEEFQEVSPVDLATLVINTLGIIAEGWMCTNPHPEHNYTEVWFERRCNACFPIFRVKAVEE